MKFICLVVYFLAYMVEPCVWMKSFSKLFQLKQTKRLFYFLAFLGIYFIIITKQLVTFSMTSNLFNTLYVPCFILFLLFILHTLYQNTVPEKILCIGILFLFSMITDVMALGVCMIFCNYSMEQINGYGMGNVVCTVLGRIFTIIFYLVIFSGRKVKMFERLITTKDVLTALIPNFAITIIYFILVHNLYVIDNDYSIVYFIVLINAVSFLFSFWFLVRTAKFRRKLQYENDSQKQLIQYQTVLYSEIENIEKQYKKLCEDLISDYGILEVLYRENNQTEMEHIWLKISEKLEKEKKSIPIYLLTNHKVEILLREGAKLAASKNIEFTSHVGIKEFGIEMEDVCSILAVMINNAIYATDGENQKDKYVRISIDYFSDGYCILCENSQKRQPLVKDDAYIINKNDNGNYGLGIRIIKEAAEKYNGNLKFGFQKGCFAIYAYIRPSGISC